MVKLNDVYKKEEDSWVSRFILDEVVIMPLCRSEEDIQYIYSISNETGSRLWQLLDGKHSVRNIQETLKSEYKEQAEVIEREILEFIGDLVKVELVQKIKNHSQTAHRDRKESRAEPRGTPQTETKQKGEKKPYKTPEITKVKMQPEQAVLSCCTETWDIKYQFSFYNICSYQDGCEIGSGCGSFTLGCTDRTQHS